MDIATIWPKLAPETRDWLIEHNGEALEPPILDDLVRANGAPLDGAWLVDDGATGRVLPDDATDWIEAVANGETPSTQ